MKVAIKNALLLTSATGLDLVTTGGALTLSKIGIAGIGVALGHVGGGVLSGLLSSQVSKLAEKKDHSDEVKLVRTAVEKILLVVKNEFLDQNNLKGNQWNKLSLKYGFSVADLNDAQTIASSLLTYFFEPLEKAFADERFIESIITAHEELQPGDLIAKVIDNLNISFPDYRKEYEKPLIDGIKEHFKERFQAYFIQELIDNEPARKTYQLQLLQSSIGYLIDTQQDVKKLLDVANQQQIKLEGINAEILSQRKEVLDSFQEQLQNFISDSKEVRLIRHHLNKQTDTRDMFRFDHQYTDFQGRKEELDLLTSFLYDVRTFCFYALSGSGGAGKSRIATELCKRAEQTGWISGFLNYDTNKHFDWSKFEPKTPTLIIFDYVLGQKEVVSNILLQLSFLQEEKKLHQPVRLLLLDRVYGEELKSAIFTSTTRYHYFGYQSGQEENAYSLPALAQDARWAMIVQLLSASDDVERTKNLLKEKKTILKGLDQLDDQKRPLFTFFSGIALKEGESVEDIKNWDTNEALKYHIQRLENKVWCQVDIWQDKAMRDELKHLIWLAAICEYLTYDDLEIIKEMLPLKKVSIKWDESAFWEDLEILFQLQQKPSDDFPIMGMKPDLLAEYFIAQHIEQLQQKPFLVSKLPILYQCSWLIRPENVWWMSWLTFNNFKENHHSLEAYERWLLDTNLSKEASIHHGSLLYNLALLYHDQGKEEEAECYYLKAIEKGHVNALYNLALLYHDQGKGAEAETYYLQAIEKGHVSALNNLALLYEAQGKSAEAENYYLQAIEKGHVSALYNLALFMKTKGI